MERPKREKANLLKSAAVAGLTFLAGGQAEAQDYSNWRTVSAQEFARDSAVRNITEDMIQRINLKEDTVSIPKVDDTKSAIVYTDKSGATYYSLNKLASHANLDYLAEQRRLDEEEKRRKAQRTEKKAEAKPASPTEDKPPVNLPVDAPAETATNTEAKPPEKTVPEIDAESSGKEAANLDNVTPSKAPKDSVSGVEEKSIPDEIPPEIADTPPVEEKDPVETEMDSVMEALGEYANRFEVKEAYFIGPDGQEHKIDDTPAEAFKDEDAKTTLSGALVIYDKDKKKNYEVLKRNKDGLTDDIFYFAEALKKSGARGGCLEFLKKQGKAELPTEEKIKYLQEFFTTGIERLEKYKKPKVYDDLAFKN